ncbi:hypothetical protein L2747_07825 [Shewanella marinintestina]|uniref:hypothetical protein n=1 Tax=Shewanella marinintestina TaxID=190305 RepID=UPI00200CBD29|nr:hypothetical protein [Shewanella marinintestina]MCL1145919.1 hypothetical protein [Shewanella marinintestina]
MNLTKQNISEKVSLFFSQFDLETKKHLHKLLILELTALQYDIVELNHTDIQSVTDYHHKYKGLCKYLNLSNEEICKEPPTKKLLLVNIEALQQLLKEC